jgi:endonuclease/exonuclease/phosphatase family metal-dependent hydrolase
MMKNIGLILLLALLWSCGSTPKNQEPEENEAVSFTVMSFNVLYSTSVESTIKTIAETGADITGLQEASDERIKETADSLGFYSHAFSKAAGNLSDNDTGILSRFPIGKKFETGVMVELPNGEDIAVFSVHLSAYPYEPYDIRDGKIETAEGAETAAGNIRLPEINPVLERIDSLMNAGVPVFLTGDFNEPSHLDWTEKAAENNMHFSMAVEWPVSKAVTDTGMEDAYRLAFPDEVEKNGITWTTNLSENEVHDRIDIVYQAMPESWELKSVKRVGRPDNDGAVKIPGYESDHYAVIASYSVQKK